MVKVPSPTAIIQGAFKVRKLEAEQVLAGRTAIYPFSAEWGPLAEIYAAMLILLHAIEYLEGKYRD